MISFNATNRNTPANAIHKIDAIDSTTFQLIVKLHDGKITETVCRVVATKAGDKIVENFKFESPEFQRHIAMGEIDIRAINKAVSQFRQEVTAKKKTVFVPGM